MVSRRTNRTELLGMAGTARCAVGAASSGATSVRRFYDFRSAAVELSDGRATVSSPRRWAWCTNPLRRRAEDSRPYLYSISLSRFLLPFLLLVSVALLPAAEPPRRDPVVVDEKTEAVIKGALKYLASKQLPNGAWGSSGDEANHPIAMTGYVLMGFLAAGQLPGEGEYGKNVTAGTQYLLD